MEYEQVGEVRGAGLIGAIELVEHRDSKAPDAALAKKVTLAAQENGLIVRNVAGNAIAVCPPLIINREQVDEMIDKLKLSLEQTI
jgi:4-aminobutyrate--pyruvate transaminase